MLHNWLRELRRRVTTPYRRPRRPASVRSRLALGRLEDRLAPAVLTFQEGANSYAGTQDAELEFDAPTAADASGGAISIDNVDGDPVGGRQGLLRFDNIFGTGANQIPFGSVINSATLTVTVTDNGGDGGQLGPYRMLVNWTEAAATWNTFGTPGGLQGDNVEMAADIESILTDFATGVRTFNVVNSVRTWAAGAPNYGWGITQKLGGGWDFASSENATASSRPLLTIDYTPPTAGSAGSLQFSDPNFSVKEGATTATVTVTRTGGVTGAVSVQYAAAAGTAGAADFTATSGTLNFAANETTKTFTVAVLADTAFEGHETITLTLSGPTGGATLGTQATATLTILDQDVLLNEVIVDLPGSDTSSEYFELVGTPGATLTNVYFVVIDGDSGAEGSATMVTDLGTSALGTNGLLVIKAATGGFTIPTGTTVVGDSQLNPANGGLTDDDSWTMLLVRSTTAIAEGTDYDTNNDGVLDLPAGAQVLDSISWTDGGATDRWYGPRVFQTTGNPPVAVRILNDDTPSNLASWFNGTLDGDSRVIIQAHPNGSYNVPTASKMTPGVANQVGFYAFSTLLRRFQGPEGGSVTITVNRVGPTTAAESVQWATSNGTAIAGTDYTAANGTLNFAVGAASASFTIPGILDDTLVEGPETFFVTLSNPSGTTLPATLPAVITINDGDDGDVNLQEEANGYFGTQDTYVWAVSPEVGQDSPFQYGVDLEEGNPAMPLWALLRFDNLIGTGTGQIPPGARVLSASLVLNIDDISDPGAAVTFHRMLADWDEGSTWNSMVDGIFRDDAEARLAEDGRVVSPGVAGAVPVEGAGLLATVQSWVNGAPNRGWTIFSNSGNGIDFGSSEDPTAANRPRLLVSYAPPTGAGTLQFEEATFNVTENTTTATIPVVRVGGTAGSVTVNYALSGGTATAGTDYTAPASGTLTFAAGVVRQTITVTVTNDTALEANETINLTLSSPGGGATLGTQATATLRIKDNERDAALRLNEILVNPSGTDNPFEYVEIIGTPGASLANVYLLALDGDGIPAIGRPDMVIDLSNAVIGSTGLVVIKATTGGHTIPSGTTVVTDARLANGDALPNNSTSFLLVFSPDGIITEGGGQDYDPEGNGVVNLPVGAVVLDSVGAVDGGAEDLVVGGVNLTIGTSDPFDGATRIRGNTTANSAAAWYYGNMTGANSAFTYSTTGVNLPANAVITPGSINYDPTAPTAPRVSSTAINGGAAQRSMVTSLAVTFNAVVTFASTPGAAFTLSRIGGGAVNFTATAATVGGVTVVTLNAFTGAETTFGSLNDGRYTLTALAAQINIGGTQLDGNGDGTAGDNYTLADNNQAGGLFRLFGDSNGDRRVDNVDFFQFRNTFGLGTGNPAFLALFDYDGNGLVDNVDFFQFRPRFGMSI